MTLALFAGRFTRPSRARVANAPLSRVLTGAFLPLALICLSSLAGPSRAQNSRNERAEIGGATDFATNVREFKRPRLTVVISIDQFRADYLRRLTDLFLPPFQTGGRVGGFRYLMSAGSYFTDARYGHFPLYTGPGHAVILTGGYPYKTGIIGNNWFDKTTLQSVYCVDDARWRVVGAASDSHATPMGPRNLRSSTVGDELKLAANGKARIVTISLKDRAAILLGGHSQDVSLWFDTAGGRWISSTAFCKSGQLPAWAEAVNSERLPDKTLGTTWSPSVGAAVLLRAVPSNLSPKVIPTSVDALFSHAVGIDKKSANYAAFTLTPDANAYVFETAKRAIAGEKLGQRDDAPDLLALNLATNDYVGHAYGPYSPEALDLTVHTDHQLADFHNFLHTTLPNGLRDVAIVVTADHGVAPIPENAQALGANAGRIPETAISAAAQDALTAAFGPAPYVGPDATGKTAGKYVEPYLYLNEAAVAQALASRKAASRAQIEEVAARAITALPGVYACYTRSQILANALPPTEITRRVVNGFYPKVAGDVVVVNEQLYIPAYAGPEGTTHGSPYAYDTHVPILIAGPGIRPGVWADPVSPADIAPTLCALLGIELPSACDGVILKAALR